MKKVLTTLFAAAFLVICLPVLSVRAEESDVWEYTLNDGQVTITGYNGNDKDIVIPSRIDGDYVIAVGNQAFKDNNSIVSVSFEEGIRTIGSEAFSGCSAMTEVVFPESLTSIGNSAFTGSKLKAAELPEGLETIGAYAFMNCGSLRKVSIPSVTEWGTDWGNNSAFANCGILTDITIGDNVSYIGPHAFENCELLEELILPETLQYVGDAAFKGCSLLQTADIYGNINNEAFRSCTSLKDLTIHDAEIIGDSAFLEATALQEVELPETLTSIGASAFCGCTKLGGIVIPDSVVFVGAYAFKDDKQLKTAVLGSGINEWGTDWGNNSAFANCKALEDLEIREGVAYIPTHCFESDSALVSIEIPASCTNLDEKAFFNCTELAYVYIRDDEEENSDLELIGPSAFDGCTELRQVNLPDSLTKIDNCAFRGTQLRSVIIPDKVETIGYYAFSECPALTDVYIGECVENWNTDWGTNGAFRNDNRISTLTIAEGVLTIGSNAFENCTSLQVVEFPVTVKTIYDNAFLGCSSLTDITIKRGTIGAGAFANCSALYNVDLGKITSIGDSAFAGDVVLYEVEIPDSVTAIGNHAFDGCSSLHEIVIADYVTYMGAYAFANCTNMTSAIIGNNITQWNNEWGENRCFGYNTSLRYVEIAEGANSIGNNAFSGCTALETVVLPKTITEWGSNIFEGCSEILTVCTSDSRTKEKLKDYSVSVSDEAPEAPEAVPVTVSVNISDESDGTGIVSPAGEISRDADSTVYVKVVPDRGSLIDSVTVGGKVFREITDAGIVAFFVDEDTELSVTFTEDPEYEDEYPPLDGEEDISPDADNEEDASPDIDDEDADVDSMPEDEDIDVDDAPEDEDADVDDMPKDEDVLTDSEESGNTSVLFSDEDELTLELTKDGLTITDETQQLTFLLEDLGLDPDDWEDGYLSQAKDRNGTEHWYLNNADDTARTQISGKEFVTE